MGHERGHKGLLYYASQSGKGSPTNPTLPCGTWGNLRARILGGTRAVRSAGARRVVDLAEDMTGVELSWDIPELEASSEQATLLNYGIATGSGGSTALTYLTVGFGTSTGGRQVEDCKLDSISLSGDNEGAFSGSVTAMGGKVATPDPSLSAPQSFLSDAFLQMHEAIYSRFELSSFRCELRNNLVMKPVIAGPATTRDPSRVWDYLTEGPEDITGSYGVYNTSGEDLQAGEIASVSPTLRFVDKGTAADELLVTVTTQKAVDETETIPGADGDVERLVSWIGLTLAVAATEY